MEAAMRRSMLQKLEVCALCVLVFTCALIPSNVSHASLQAGTIEARIQRVENGLLPPAILKGEAARPMKLFDRMQFYKTPGLSLAVINEGRIEWARAYGTLEAGGKAPVTATT